MSAPKWDYREGFIRNKGADKFGNLVFHVPWTIGDRSAGNPNYAIMPPSGRWLRDKNSRILAVEGTWMWDRFVISAFPMSADGSWQFYELILSKDHVPGQWAQQQWQLDVPKISAAYRSFEDAELRYASWKYGQKFGWLSLAAAPPGRIMQWYREGMGDKLPKPKCRVPTPAEMEASRKNPLDKALGYAMYCEEYREAMIKADMEESYGRAGVIAYDTATTVAESTIGQFIADIVGEATGAVTVSEEDKDEYLKNRPKLPKFNDIMTYLVVFGGVAVMAYMANKE